MLNQANIIGRLGRDPEIRYTSGGTTIANLSVATSEHWTDGKGNRQETTEWHRVVLFDRSAEVAGEYLKKGSLVYVGGKIRTRRYTDAQGVERYATEIAGREMKILANGTSTSDATSDRPARPGRQAPAAGPSDLADDEIPF